MSVTSIGLVANVGNVATDYTKLAVVYGTLIGFTMISIIVTVGSVMSNGINRVLVSHCYYSTGKSLLLQHRLPLSSMVHKYSYSFNMIAYVG